MLKTLALRGFRGFESYELTDLATVNLIVGKNNCGKTTILEAVELLVSNGHPFVVYEVARRRGEVPSSGNAAEISHLFFGHVCKPGVCFTLSSDDSEREMSATILSLDDVGEDANLWADRRSLTEEETDPAFGLRLGSRATGKANVLPVADDGTIPSSRWPRSIRNVASGAPVRFLTLESVASERMRDAWNEVLAEGREDEIARDMEFLVPEIDSIHFLTGGTVREGSILVGRRGGGRRMPIGSYGDGLRRLLALRLAVVGANHGFLLIDEIDAGLHWTVMEDVWRLLVEVAKKSDVQIFATTHSYDCIRGLGSLVRSRPELGGEISIQKVHPSLKQAVSFAGEQIAIAVEQQIELR